MARLPDVPSDELKRNITEYIRVSISGMEQDAIPAFLASPQAAQELAAALEAVPVGWLGWTDRMDRLSTEYQERARQAKRNAAAAIMAAWREGRTG